MDALENNIFPSLTQTTKTQEANLLQPNNKEKKRDEKSEGVLYVCWFISMLHSFVLCVSFLMLVYVEWCASLFIFFRWL